MLSAGILGIGWIVPIEKRPIMVLFILLIVFGTFFNQIIWKQISSKKNMPADTLAKSKGDAGS